MSEDKTLNVIRLKDKYSFIYLLVIVCVVFYFVDIFISCRPSSTTPYVVQRDDYLGDQSCKSCHAIEYEKWTNSHHDEAMQAATPETVLGDFNDASFEHMGLTTRFYKKDEKFYVNTEDSSGSLSDFEVEYTFGVTPLQQYLVRILGGRLQCLLTAWDSEQNKWFQLNPDERFSSEDWMHWSGGSMTWNTMCADCHSTYLEKNYDENTHAFSTQWALIDVNCEACHGPGKAHIDYIASKDYSRGRKKEGSYMFQTKNLKSEDQVDQCARCHALRSQITSVYDHSGELMDHYVPNLINPPMYYADGQILEEDYVYSSFLQSKMYHRGVKCTDCHDPHTTKLKLTGNTLCLQCHVSTQYDTPKHHFHKLETEGSLCIDCHMTGKVYMGNDYRRDHSFRIPRPDQSVLYGTPNACIQCHTEESNDWAAQAIVDWYGPERKKHYSDVFTSAYSGDRSTIHELKEMIPDTSQTNLVRATAIWYLGEMRDQSSLGIITEALNNANSLIRHSAVRAIDFFSSEIKMRYLVAKLSDPVRSIRTQTVFALAGISKDRLDKEQMEAFDKAEIEHENVLAMQADFPVGRLIRGQFEHKKGDLEKAEKSYLEAIEIDPYLTPAHFNLANMYYQQNRFDLAEQVFRKILDFDSENIETNYSLGLLLAEMNKLNEAETCMKTAARLSGNVRYYYNLGLIQQNLQKPGDAASSYLKALKIEPNSEANLYALTILCIQQKELGKAKLFASKLAALFPDNPNYQQMWTSLQ